MAAANAMAKKNESAQELRIPGITMADVLNYPDKPWNLAMFMYYVHPYYSAESLIEVHARRNTTTTPILHLSHS